MREVGNRQADRRALDGGHAHKTVGSAWSPRAEQPPLLDEESTRYPKKKGKKKAPKKERCQANPNGHTHEWMKDTEEIPVYSYGNEPFWCYERRSKKPVGTKLRLYKLCVHCGIVRFKSRGSWVKPSDVYDYFTQYRWRGRKVIH